MSGGVDSSVAAALLADDGHEVVGVTMRLWGGESDTGCCSVSDVDDARRVAQQLDIDHLVFNFTEDFDGAVVEPYVDAHAAGSTPNPCIECNRRVKFARLAERADVLGFDAVATGHHARIARRRRPLDAATRRRPGQGPELRRAHARPGRARPARCSRSATFADKAAAAGARRELGLRTAAKPDSQDVCFITSTGGRHDFLRRRLPLHPARRRRHGRRPVGEVAAVELVTIGQRKGLGLPGGGPKRFVVDVDRAAGTVVVGSEDELLRPVTSVGRGVVGRRAGRRRGARAVQRPRRVAPGDARRRRRRRRRALARARSGASRRARASSSTTPATVRARRRHRRVAPAPACRLLANRVFAATECLLRGIPAGDTPTAANARISGRGGGGGRPRAARRRGATAHEQRRQVDRPPARRRRARREHDRGGLAEADRHRQAGRRAGEVEGAGRPAGVRRDRAR